MKNYARSSEHTIASAATTQEHIDRDDLHAADATVYSDVDAYWWRVRGCTSAVSHRVKQSECASLPNAPFPVEAARSSCEGDRTQADRDG
jgi:hypothetical protein